MSFVKFGKFGNSQFLYFIKYFFSSAFFLFSFQDFDDSNSISFIIVHEVPEAIFFFSLSVVKLSNLEDCSTFKLTDFMLCSDVEFPVSLVFWLLYFSVPNFSFASLPYFLKLSIFSLISILFIIAS